MNRVLVAPGVRTDPGHGWRSAMGTALALVLGDPALWLLGLLGFAARGGFVVLVVPIVTIPSPVLLSILFRGEISTSGVTPAFATLAVAIVAALALCMLFGLFAAAYADVTAYERSMRDQETDQLRNGLTIRALVPSERRSLIIWVAAIESAGLVPILLAVLATVDRLAEVLVHELQAPSALDVPLTLRVVRDITPELLVTLVVAIIAEVFVSMGARRLMASRLGLLQPAAPAGGEVRIVLAGARRALRHPGRTTAATAAAWVATLATVVPVLCAVMIAWGGVRDVLLTPGLDDAARIAASAIALVVFGSIWFTGLVLVGVGSALRTAIWSVDGLR